MKLGNIVKFFRHADGVNTTPQTEFERNLHAMIHQPRTAYGEEVSGPRNPTACVGERSWRPLNIALFIVGVPFALWIVGLLVSMWDVPFRDW